MGFSLSQTTLKIFNALNIEARRSVRVFVHFQVRSEILAIAWPFGGGGLENQWFPGGTQAQAPGGDAVVDVDAPVQKTIDISVSCRLVKDHKATIQLRARVRPSSLKVSTYNLAYRGSLNCLAAGTLSLSAPCARACVVS